MRVITDLVSLGYNCRTTRRVRDHFQYESAFPFDWWVTPLKGAARFLSDWDVERLFDPDQLAEERAGESIAYVHHRRYGIKLQHDFPIKDGRVVLGWREHIDSAKSRTRHLMAKLDCLDDPARRILFYRELSPLERPEPTLLKALRKQAAARAQRAHHAFLLISPQGVAAEGWMPLRINDPDPAPWSGNPQIWNDALASLGFSLVAPN